MSDIKIDLPELIIEPGRTEKNYWRDIWLYRELFYILSWRDIKVRYKQTVIGAVWSILRPLLTMIIFTIIFGRSQNFLRKVQHLMRLWYMRPCCPGNFFRMHCLKQAAA